MTRLYSPPGIDIRSTEIEIGYTSSDWEPKTSEKFYAQFIDGACEYAFGPSPVAALTNVLLKRNLE